MSLLRQVTTQIIVYLSSLSLGTFLKNFTSSSLDFLMIKSFFPILNFYTKDGWKKGMLGNLNEKEIKGWNKPITIFTELCLYLNKSQKFYIQMT